MFNLILSEKISLILLIFASNKQLFIDGIFNIEYYSNKEKLKIKCREENSSEEKRLKRAR